MSNDAASVPPSVYVSTSATSVPSEVFVLSVSAATGSPMAVPAGVGSLASVSSATVRSWSVCRPSVSASWSGNCGALLSVSATTAFPIACVTVLSVVPDSSSLYVAVTDSVSPMSATTGVYVSVVASSMSSVPSFHCHSTSVTPPSGSVSDAVSAMPVLGRSDEKVIDPSSATLVTVTRTSNSSLFRAGSEATTVTS